MQRKGWVEQRETHRLKTDAQMEMLKRFWFVLKKSAVPSVLDMGCGTTALDLKDAHSLLEACVFPIYGEHAVEHVLADVDISLLDEKHVRPNMGNPVIRGVWFPLI